MPHNLIIKNFQKGKYSNEGRFLYPAFNIEVKIYSDFSVSFEYVKKCIEHLLCLDDFVIDAFCAGAINYCESYREFFDDENIEIPKTISGREILKYIKPKVLIIEPTIDNVPSFHMEFDCKWEPEHGLEWVVCGNEVLYVGQFIDVSPCKNKEKTRGVLGNYAPRYTKVAFGTTSGANENIVYKIDEITEAPYWHPEENGAQEMGGFSFSTDTTLLRWLVRGDTLYDVVLPDDAEVVMVNGGSVPNGVFRTNKIILTNPRHITDDVAMSLYQKSNLPTKAYYKALAGLAIRGHINTAKALIKDRVDTTNIDVVLGEFDDFVSPGIRVQDNFETYEEVLSILRQIKNNKNKRYRER